MIPVSKYPLWISCDNGLQFLASNYLFYLSFCGSFKSFLPPELKETTSRGNPFGTATIAVTSCSLQGHWINWEFVFFPSKTPVYLQTPALTLSIQLPLPLIIVSQPGKNDLMLKFLMLWGVKPHRLYRKRQRFLVTLVQSHSLPPHNIAGEQINSLSTQLSKSWLIEKIRLKPNES